MIMGLNKKIIHFHPNGAYASIFVDPLIQAEKRHGIDSKLICSANNYVSGGIDVPYDISIKNLPLLIISFVRIFCLLTLEKPDLVISHNSKSSVLPLLAAYLSGVKSRIYFNHGVPFIGYRGFVRYVLRRIEKINCSLSTEIVTVSSDMQNILNELKSSAPIRLINHGSASGIDFATFNSINNSSLTFRIKNNIKEDDLVVVYVGRPVRRKGFNFIVNFWAENIKDKSFKLVLCGPDKSSVMKIIDNIPDNIICLGFINNMPEVLLNSDLLMLPSYHEGLPYSVLEAMACNCMVVANDIPGIKCIVKHRENGFIVKNNSIHGYLKIIESLKIKTAENINIKNNAYQYVLKYSRSSFLMAYMVFIDKILK